MPCFSMKKATGDVAAKEKTSLLSLPAELRMLIYEALAQDTPLKGNNHNRVLYHRDAAAILQTCSQIQDEAWPAFLRCSQISLQVKDWDLRSVRRFIGALDSQSLKALRANDRIVIVLVASVWDEDKHRPRIDAWLQFCQAAAIDFKYVVKRSQDGPKWKSKAQFLWMTGIEELRHVPNEGVNLTRSPELAKIIKAFDGEAMKVDDLFANQRAFASARYPFAISRSYAHGSLWQTFNKTDSQRVLGCECRKCRGLKQAL